MSHLLLVDDNDLDAERVERGLRQLGSQVQLSRAHNGLEALEFLTERHRSGTCQERLLVMLDINMPKMNGLEFLETVRATPALAHTPVMILTTSSRPKDIADAHRLDVAGFLVKPVQRDAFLHMLSTLLAFWDVCEFPAPEVGGVQ